MSDLIKARGNGQWEILEKSTGLTIKYHGIEDSDHEEDNESHHVYSVHKDGKHIGGASAAVKDHSFGSDSAIHQHSDQVKSLIDAHLKRHSIKPGERKQPLVH